MVLSYLSTWALPLLLLGGAVTSQAEDDPPPLAAADYYVDSLPGQPEGPPLKMHAGHIEVDPEHNGNLFFWHFQNRHIANRQRTVIWLNGGPGCSSMDGALMEVGPYRLKNDTTLEFNDGSWDEFANLLFVDQPVGTGFSFVNSNKYLRELDQVGEHFLVFLEKFFKLFPQYEDDDLYFSGESYAGQYIPYIAQAVLARNELAEASGDRPWNIKGILIGNGWISPVDQYEAYLTYAYKSGVVTGGSDIADKLEAQQTLCLSAMSQPGGTDKVHIPECEKVVQETLRLTKTSDNMCYNMYDVRLRDTYSSCGMNWPEDLIHAEPYLRNPDVVRALNVNEDKKTGWTECSGSVGGNFNALNSKPSITIIPELIEAGIPITLFSGDQDFICNHIGTEEMIHNMKWGGATGFELEPGVWAPRHDWTFEGESAGIYQKARNLTYVLFYNASHMVPYDYPRRSRDMLDRFLDVDITSIGGEPADSRIDGEKVPQTSVGGNPNSAAAEQSEKDKLKDAEWNAYYRSGEAALVVVVIAGAVWGFFIWRGRRRRGQSSGYQGVYQNRGAVSGSDALENFRIKRSENADIEAGDFDESELDNLHSDGLSRSDEREREHYAIGESSDSELDEPEGYRDEEMPARRAS